jgi:hypothetical protein
LCGAITTIYLPKLLASYLPEIPLTFPNSSIEMVCRYLGE